MGEAKQRKLAKAAGKPWVEDQPKVFPHEGQYLGDDGEWHPQADYYHRRRRPNLALPMLLAMAQMGGRSVKK